MFHYTINSTKTIPEALGSVEKRLKENGFGVLWHLDIAQTLEKKGVEFKQPYHVLEVCNPVEAKTVLEQNPLVGYFLPCKIVVYESEGQTKVGLTKPTALIELVHDKELEQTAQKIEETLIKALEDAI